MWVGFPAYYELTAGASSWQAGHGSFRVCGLKIAPLRSREKKLSMKEHTLTYTEICVMAQDALFDEGGLEVLGASKKSAALVTAAAAIASFPPSRNTIASTSACAH